jgi:hypothetical protein
MNFDDRTDTFPVSRRDALTPKLNYRPRRKRPPRLPWKRGPAAWEIAKRADEILERLARCPRGFLSLRRTAWMLGISTQPLRDWIRRGYIKRNGPRLQFAKDELSQFVKSLERRATPFGPHGYLERLHRNLMRPPYRFDKLKSGRIAWPKGRKTLSPKEFAQLAGCHPSLVIKGIHEHELRGRRRTPCRWEIVKRPWE